jgi:hypothetical protein
VQRRVTIISNINDHKGLYHDYLLVRRACEAAGHEVTGVDFREPSAPSNPNLTICLEHSRSYLLSTRNWLIPNPEWWWQDTLNTLPRFERVLCKTQDGLKLMRPLTDRAEFLGFTSQDRLDTSVPRERAFFHNAGESRVKGTLKILITWEQYHIPYPLTVVGKVDPMPIPNVTFHRWLEDATHKREQNRHQFHLCLSSYEGWGHYLHEALSVGAVMASTDHPPMNEFAAAERVPTMYYGTMSLAHTGWVEEPAIRRAVKRMAAMTDKEIAAASALARTAYDVETTAFAQRWAKLMETL